MTQCDKTQELLIAYIDGKLEAALQQKIERHLSTCRRCAGEFDNLHTLVDHLDETARHSPHDKAEALLSARLLASYDAGELQSVEHPAHAERKRSWLLISIVSMAALALLALVLMPLLHNDAPSDIPGQTDSAAGDSDGGDARRAELAGKMLERAQAFLAASGGQMRHQRMMEAVETVSSFDDCALFEQVVNKLGADTGKTAQLEDLIHHARGRASLARITFAVEPVKAEYASMENVQLRITLTNQSDETVRLRPFFNLTVRDASGKKYEPHGILRDNQHAHNDLIELAPRASTTLEETLNPFEHAVDVVPQYVFNRPGRYTVRLGYRLFPHLLEEWGILEQTVLQTWHDYVCGEYAFETVFEVK